MCSSNYRIIQKCFVVFAILVFVFSLIIAYLNTARIQGEYIKIYEYQLWQPSFKLLSDMKLKILFKSMLRLLMFAIFELSAIFLMKCTCKNCILQPTASFHKVYLQVSLYQLMEQLITNITKKFLLLGQLLALYGPLYTFGMQQRRFIFSYLCFSKKIKVQ